MLNPVDVEAKYQEFVQDLSVYVPEGVTPVDLELLHSLGILTQSELSLSSPQDPLTRYFHVIETNEKITLLNDQFAVWIVPQMVEHEPVTVTLVALCNQGEPQLEMAFCASGVYNSSRIVLRVLERILEEIDENEQLLDRLDYSSE